MKRLTKLIPNTIQAIEDLPSVENGHLYTTLDPGELQIRFEYVPEIYLSIRRKMSKKWKYSDHRFNELTGNYYVYFYHREFGIELVFEMDISNEYQPGANCKLVEIGHKTQVIYGLECKENDT